MAAMPLSLLFWLSRLMLSGEPCVSRKISQYSFNTDEAVHSHDGCLYFVRMWLFTLQCASAHRAYYIYIYFIKTCCLLV